MAEAASVSFVFRPSLRKPTHVHLPTNDFTQFIYKNARFIVKFVRWTQSRSVDMTVMSKL